MHGPQPLAQDTRVVQRTQGQSLLFCLQVLLQPERWRQISEHWEGFRRIHEKRLISLLRPLLTRRRKRLHPRQDLPHFRRQRRCLWTRQT